MTIETIDRINTKRFYNPIDYVSHELKKLEHKSFVNKNLVNIPDVIINNICYKFVKEVKKTDCFKIGLFRGEDGNDRNLAYCWRGKKFNRQTSKKRRTLLGSRGIRLSFYPPNNNVNINEYCKIDKTLAKNLYNKFAKSCRLMRNVIFFYSKPGSSIELNLLEPLLNQTGKLILTLFALNKKEYFLHFFGFMDDGFQLNDKQIACLFSISCFNKGFEKLRDISNSNFFHSKESLKQEIISYYGKKVSKVQDVTILKIDSALEGIIKECYSDLKQVEEAIKRKRKILRYALGNEPVGIREEILLLEEERNRLRQKILSSEEDSIKLKERILSKAANYKPSVQQQRLLTIQWLVV